MENLGFLFAAYAAVWMLLFLYILRLSGRNKALARELKELQALLEQMQRRGPT